MTRFRLPLAGFAALLALFAFAAPAVAQVTIFSPFNLPGAVDSDIKVLGKDIAYADGNRKKLDIYGPKDPVGPSPVVMFIYGGAWKAGDKFEYEFVGRALAANGFIAVIADYRLYPEVKYPDFLEDNAQAIRWIQDNISTYGGDPQRFFLAGHSAGAYNAVMLGLEHSFLKDYGVTMPILAIAGISGPYDFYPFEYDEVRTVFGANDNPQGTQPINLVAPDDPPMLLLSGTSDPIVRVQNTQNMAKKLKAAGDWVTTKYYDGAGHLEPVISMGAMWRWRFPVLKDVVDFFSQFGAFPSGAPRPYFTPAPPEGQPDIQQVVDKLDTLFNPIETSKRRNE